jgi:HK97 family phage prohead protease
MKPERRYVDLSDLEFRADDEGGDPIVSGHAAVFDQLSEDLGGFREKIAKGAFKRALREKADVVLLVNHEGLPLARTSAKTLSLKEDAEGLRFEATLDGSDPDVQRIVPKMKRGDLTKMSFAFRTIKDRWENDAEGKTTTRTLLDVQPLDVSLVTFPAYPQTDASVRADLEGAGVLELVYRHLPTAAAERSPAGAGSGDEGAERGPSLSLARARLELAEKTA